MAILLTNIAQLVNTRTTNQLLRGKALAELPLLNNAWLLVEQDRIADFGSMDALPQTNAEVYDVQGGTVLPAFVDSHTHLVFAASRENEFVDKIRGLSYAEIAANGGGILNSAARLVNTDEDTLYQLAAARLHKLILLGTGAIEIKSGYGLSTEAELKMLRVIRRLKQNFPIPIKATFLGAHSFPPEYKQNHEGYVQLIIHEMIPAVAAENLAEYIDVFCEQGFFTPDQTTRILEAGKAAGLLPKIHANQLHVSGGVETSVAAGAISVDHLESMNQEAIHCLAKSNTIGTLLPTAAYFLRMPFQPARELIDAGCAVAIASDFNPGSSPSGNMQTVVSMSCIQMRMLPEEAINAATLNAAYALQLENEVGSITVGKKANLMITQPIPSIAYLPYAFGENHVARMLVNGQWYD